MYKFSDKISLSQDFNSSINNPVLSSPIFGTVEHKGIRVSGTQTYFRSALKIYGTQIDILLRTRIYEVAELDVLLAKGNYKTPKSFKAKFKNHLNKICAPLILNKRMTKNILNLALKRERRTRDIVIPKIDMSCIYLKNEEHIEDKYIHLHLDEAQKIQRLRVFPLYYLTLPFFSLGFQMTGFETLPNYFDQLFQYIWPYADIPRMPNKTFNKYLKKTGELSAAWIDRKKTKDFNDPVDIDEINKYFDVFLRVSSTNKRPTLLGQLLKFILDGLLSDMTKKTNLIKCQNPECYKYFAVEKKTKRSPQYCPAPLTSQGSDSYCKRRAAYLRNKKK